MHLSTHTARASDNALLTYARDPYGVSCGRPVLCTQSVPARGVLLNQNTPARYFAGANNQSALRMPAGLLEAAPARPLRSANISASPPEVVCLRFTCADTRGKSAPFRAGYCCNPYPPHYRTAFASSLLLYPQPHRLLLRVAFPDGRTTGLPRSSLIPTWVRLCLSAGGASSAVEDR
jgi:hypothetical protein